MRVGVVLMCDLGKQGCTPLVNTLLALGHIPLVMYCNDSILQTIQTSGIDHWIFSGNATYTKDEDMYRMPMAVFSLPIHVFCICYSFQSALIQLGYTLHHKRKRVNKRVQLPRVNLCVNLNYTQYIQSPVKGELASYNNEAMMVRYKNALLTQFHPEATADGRKLLVSFLQNEKKS